MADDKQIIFTPSDYGSASILDNSSPLNYLTRYRLVTEEQQVISDWSHINTLQQDSVSTIITGFTPQYTISSVESGGTRLNIRWTVPDKLTNQKFDIYFSWSYNGGSTYTSFIYAETITANTYYIDIPYQSSVKATHVQVAVQVPTSIKTVNSNALLFQSTAQSTLPILDAGTI
jgi:hypothetical protein